MEREGLDAGCGRTTRGRITPAVALFFLSPLVGEFLLGNVAIDAFLALFFLAPLYGAGAVLIRESARRAGRGWPTMVVLGVAYALWEESVVTQLLFNPSYHGLALTGAVIPGLGVSATQTINILTLHAVWSVAVPIAVVEAYVPARRATPWLGRVGLAAAAVTFLLGSAFIAYSEYEESGFFASVPQLFGALAAVGVLVASAFALPPDSRSDLPGSTPGAWVILGVSFVATSLFMALLFGLICGWPGVAAWVGLIVCSVALVARWAARPNWGDRHPLALAAGALLTYSWSAFPQQPVLGTPGQVDLVGNVVFAGVAVALPAVAAVRLGRRAA